MEYIKCKNCGVLIEKKLYAYRKQFCSVCLKERQKRRITIEKVCPVCNIIYNPTNKNQVVCSPICREAFKKVKSGYKNIEVKCYICGKTKFVTPSKFNSTKLFFCSKVHYYKARSELSKLNKNTHWKNGISNSLKYYNISNDNNYLIREQIRKRDNYICCLCYKKQNKEKFIVHHIDYDKTNWNESNLITLCRNCHMTIHNNKIIEPIKNIMESK